MLNMWILVADSGAARLFTADSPTGPLREREDFTTGTRRASRRAPASARR